ncbi:phasin family protein [Marilutibacter chinensis]|uniref:Phasin family protein n=1 Tax=Marilutibacter chinensis TaxID=2912247 RepID=A0ABS9HR43_9GAMM|nr:phasin family protein [Lysobacter chinensis]MCF7220567.1 phasin family protein [Lysobacter chinensis]
MAKLKKSAKKAASPATDPQQQAERLAKGISESAQQIWLAGMGAFARAQAEGTKLFEGLVKEGLGLEKSARKFAGDLATSQADAVRDAVENRVGQARERAADTWDRLEKVFEERVQRALVKLGVPGRDDLADLSRRVEALTAELRRQGGGKTAKAPSRTAASRSAKTAAKKATASRAKTRPATAKKAAGKPARKTATRKAARKASPGA